MFVPGKPFQPSLVIAGKARTYISEAPTNTRLAWNGLPGANALALQISINYGRKKFNSTGPRRKVSKYFFEYIRKNL